MPYFSVALLIIPRKEWFKRCDKNCMHSYLTFRFRYDYKLEFDVGLSGAHILDIGGQSTRPNAARIPASEELERVIPVIR
eukprot:scaffold84742_cov36-Prasinocladus_malaysianus.AAC.1